MRRREFGRLPGGAVVDGNVHSRHLDVAGPGVPRHLQFARIDCQTGLRRGDQRLYGHRVDDTHVLFRNRLARRDRIGRNAVGGTRHLGAVMDHVAQPDAREPLLRTGARPAGNHQAQGRPVHRMQRTAVHFKRDQVVGVHCLFQRDAARNRQFARRSGQVQVGAFVGRVDRRLLVARGLQHVGQAHAGPFGAPDRAKGPLVAPGRGFESRPAVAAAFDYEPMRHHLEPAAQLLDTERHGALDQPVNLQRPGVGVHVRGNNAVVADEMTRDRRDFVIEQVRGGLRVQGPVVQHLKPLLALQWQCLRSGGGNKAGPRPAIKRESVARHRGGGGHPCPFQKPSALYEVHGGLLF